MIGQHLGGYEILEVLGSGGMATVYKAYDPGTDRNVAIKLMAEHYSQNPIFRERFQREAKAIAKLEHPHILPIHSYGEEGDRAYIVMRYMPTGTLADLLAEGPLPLEQVSYLLTQIASALDAAHEHGVIHRDVKPSNILLDKRHDSYLSDFGIAQILETSQNLTGSGIIGTPAYMSPEQSTAKTKLTGAADQYSLGIILYQMVTGVRPFEADTPLGTILQHINEPLPDPRELRPDLSYAAAQVIERVLAKNPEDRYSTCSEMVSAFANAISGIAPSIAVSKPAPQRTRPARTKPAVESLPTTDVSMPHRRIPVWLLGVIGAGIIGVLVIALVISRGGGKGGSQAAESTDEQGGTPVVGAFSMTRTARNLPTNPPEDTSGATRTHRPTSTPDPVDLAEVLSFCLNTICIDGSSGQSVVRMDGVYTPASGFVTWSSDGQRILYSACPDTTSNDWSCARIYSVSRDGTDIREFAGTGNQNPVMSPDGQWIAFTNPCSVYVMRSDGTGTKLIYSTPSGVCNTLPVWSPDSQHIAWIEDAPGGNFIFPTIWVAKIDGTDAHAIYYDMEEPLNWQLNAWSLDGLSVAVQTSDGITYLLDASCDVRSDANFCKDSRQTLPEFPVHWTHAYFPQWAGETIDEPTSTASPDPAELVEYLTNCGGNVCINGGGQSPIVLALSDDYLVSTVERELSWSPDGQQIAFVAGPQPGTLTVYLVNRDGTNVRPLRIDADMPAWQPNGDLIAYHMAGNINVMHADGTGERTIAAGGTNPTHHFPVWSPDGQQLAWSQGVNWGAWHTIWVSNFDGTNIHAVFSDTVNEVQKDTLVWTPDGQSLVFVLSTGKHKQVSATCDVNTNECEVENAEPYPVYWTHRYFPQWAGETIVTLTPAP